MPVRERGVGVHEVKPLSAKKNQNSSWSYCLRYTQRHPFFKFQLAVRLQFLHLRQFTNTVMNQCKSIQFPGRLLDPASSFSSRN